jgi:small-conductance mechanosensitive channel
MQSPARIPPTENGEPTPARDVGESIDTLQELYGSFIDALPSIGLGLVVIAVFVALGWIIRWAVRRLNEIRGKPYALALALGRLASGATILLGVLIAAVIVFPNFTPAKLLQLFGFGSVAIGFAFRDVLQNYLAGILLLLTQPFRIGDAIIVGEYEGVVQNIQTRATFVRTYDGRRVVIPNGELFTSSVVVNTAYDRRRVEYDIGIGYGDDLDLARGILLDILKEEPTAVDVPPPDVLVYELGGEAVLLRARWWIDPPQKRDLLHSRDSVLLKAKQRLTKAGVDLPFPTQQILFHDQTDEHDGDRQRQREGWPADPQQGDPKPRWRQRLDGERP